MVPSTVALLVISLFTGAYSAPQLCISCATSGSLRQVQSSQRSENLEDLTQQAESELHRIPTQLAFDNSRPGNWEEQNQYRTPDGHGQVFEEQGQKVDGGRRIRYYRKNFTSSYSSGNAGGLAGTDLAGFGSSGRQSVTQNYLGQGQNEAFDRSTTHGNSYLSRGSGQGYESYGRPLTGYQSTHDQTSTSGNTYVSQDSSRTVGRTSENSHGSYGHPSSVHSAVNQGQNAGYDQTITRGNSYVAEDSSQTTEGLTGRNSYGRYDSYERPLSSRQTVGHSAVDQGQGTRYDQTITRGNSYVAEGASQTRGGLTGHNGYGGYDSYRRPLSGQQTVGQVHDRTVTQDNSHIYQSSGDDTQETQKGSAVWDQTRPGNWTEVDTYRTDGGRGIVHERQGQYVTGPKQVRFYVKNYTSSYTSGGGIPSTDLGLDSTSILDREMQNLHREIQQVDRTVGAGSTITQSPIGYNVRPLVIRPVSNYPTQHPITSGSNSYQTISHHTQRTQDASSLPGVVPLYSDSQALRNYYDRLTQTQQSQYVQTYGTRGLSQNQISMSNVLQQPGQVRHYEQSQTSSTSSSQHPGVDRTVLQVSSNNGRQQTYNTQNSFGRTSGYNQGSVYAVPSGQLVTHAIDLGQVAQGPDCDEGTSGYSQYQQTQRLRTYRRASQSDDLAHQTEDLTQQTEDLTQQTQDLTQQTEDLTQQTEDLTQQTEDLTLQSQHVDQFGQHSSWKPGKLEFGSQQVQDLTQQTEDLTQQTQQVDQFGQHSSWKPGKLEFGSQQGQDLTQQIQDLTQQTEDLTQQTQDLTQQTEDLAQQTQQLDQFGQHSSWKPGKLEFGSQQVQDLTQQTQDLTQQTEDLTQQTEDLTQQTEQVNQFGQHSSWKPGKLEFGSQQGQDLTQQTEDLTQQTQDLTQQTEDFTQQTEDLAQQTQSVDQFGQHSSWKPGKLEFGSQQGQDLTQQTEDLTQQTQDLTQQTEDFTQQTEDLTQQTQDLAQQTQQVDQFGQHSSWKPGKMEFGSQQSQDLTQQTQDLTQQTEDLTQQTRDLTQQTEDLAQQTQQVDQFGQHSSWKPGKLEFGSQQGQDFTQQTQDLTQQTQDLTQQTEDLTQQTQDLAQQTQQVDQFGQHSSWKPGKLEFGSQQSQDLTQQTHDLTQQTEDLTQQTQDLTQQTEDLTQQREDLTQQTQQVDQFGQHSLWKPGKLEFGSQQGQDLTQQTQDLTQQTQDLTQQTEDLTQQTEDLTQQTQQVDQFGQHSSWKPGQLEFGSQHGQDLTQQTEDLTQQAQDLTQQTEDLTQQTEDLTQQTEDLSQQTQHVHEFGQHSSWKPGKLEFGSQQGQDFTQQTHGFGLGFGQETTDVTQATEDLTQQTQDSGDFGQQTSWNYGQLESGNHQVEDLTQQTQDSGDFGQQTSWNYGQSESGNHQVEDLTQQTQDSGDFGQQTSWNYGQSQTGHHQVEDLTQQTQSSGDFGQESSWDSHNQESGFNHGPIIPGQGAVQERRPAPKPQGRPRPTSPYYIYPVTIQVTEQPKIDAIPLNYAQENNQKWETAEDLHHSETELAVPAAPKRGDQGVDPDFTDDEDYLAGVSTEPTTPKSQDQTKRFTKSGRRGSYRGPQYRPQVIEPLAHYVQKSEQLEAQPLPVISPRILEAYGGNGPYDVDHRPDFGSVKPNPNLIITPPETDAWDVSARGLSAPEPPPVITTPEPTTTEEPTTTPEPTTTTPAPGFWGRLGHKISNTYEKAKEKAKELIG